MAYIITMALSLFAALYVCYLLFIRFEHHIHVFCWWEKHLSFVFPLLNYFFLLFYPQLRKPLLVLLFVLLQSCALLWYSLSYVPGAHAAVRWALRRWDGGQHSWSPPRRCWIEHLCAAVVDAQTLLNRTFSVLCCLDGCSYWSTLSYVTMYIWICVWWLNSGDC